MFNPKALILFLILLPFISFAQENYLIDFDNAVKLYSNKKFSGALSLFDKVSKDFPENSRTTAAILFKGKTLLALNRLSDAKNLVLDLLNKYPSSKYTDEARILLSRIYFEEKDFFKSFTQLLNIVQETDSAVYAVQAITYGKNLAAQYLSDTDLKSLYNSNKDEKVKSYLLLNLAGLQMSKGSFDDARASLTDLIKLYPNSGFLKEAETLLSKIPKTKSLKDGETIICAMLPLSSTGNESLTASKEILEGIKFALDEFNNGRNDKIGLVIKDTENNRDKIVKIKNEIINNPSIKLIIGPVFSNEVSIALEEFRSSGIPIVSPTATENDLTLLYEIFFQANPNFVIRAKGMAQYIYYVENKRRIAILNSIEGYSPLLAAEFSKEFEKLGGRITAKYTYKSENLSSGIKIDTIKLISAEGVYIPISDKRDAPLLFSQLVKYNVRMPVYGNQDWFQAKGFETSPELSNNMIFTSDYFIEYGVPEYQDFNKNFMSKTKIDANRNALYGYDAAKYILTILRNISREREIIKAKMETGITVNGFHNNISFNRDRVNCFINIVRYNEGQFELVDKFKTSN